MKTATFRPVWWLLTVIICLALGCAAAQGEGAVSGCAFMDDNLNAVCDAGEQLMTGAPVRLEQKTAGGWKTVADGLTDMYGAFAFEGLAAGEYRVVSPLQNYSLYVSGVGGSEQSTSAGLPCSQAFSLADGETVRMDIALRQAAQVQLTAFQDANADGARAKNERSLSGAVAQLLPENGDAFTLTTDQNGQAALYVKPGAHTLALTLPQGYVLTAQGSENSFDAAGQKQAQLEKQLSAGETWTVSAAAYQVGSLSGMVFEDMNNNGVLDDGEPGVEGVALHLQGKRTGLSLDVQSGADGRYSFDGLPDDTYTISATLPEGMLYARYSKTGGDLRSIFSGSTREREYVLKKAAQLTGKNVGLVQRGVIRGQAFLDLNYNGVLDEGEPGYAGVTVEAIKISNGESLGKTVTASDGTFAIENLRGGDYRLRTVLPDDGSIFSATGAGAAEQVNLFAQRNGRRESSIQPLSIVSGGEAYALVGVARGAVITGTVFEDADYNGVWNGKEKAISGLKVSAVDADGHVGASDTTGAKGSYKLSGILPGRYTVQVQRKKGYGFTRLRDQEKGGNHVAMLQGEAGVTAALDVAMGESYSDINAGMLPSSTVSGQLFYDSNDNGLWDENEPGAVQVQVRLYSQAAEMDLIQNVQPDGSYFFDGVMPGEYTLTYLLPEHYEMAHTAQGGNTVSHNGAQTQTDAFQVTMGEKVTLPLAGAVELGSYEGVAFHDVNGNGVQDAGEEPMAGVRLAFTGTQSAEAETGSDGSFHIRGLRPGSYSLMAQAPEGYIFSHSPDSDGVLWPAEGQVTLADFPWAALAGHSKKALGVARPATIEGQVWMDENQDGKQQEQEWIVSGLTLNLTDEASGETVATVRTDEKGFRFEKVRPGSYTVSFSLPEQASPAGEAAGTFVLSGGQMRQTGLIVDEGRQVTGLQTGLVSRTSIAGHAYLDESGARSPVTGLAVQLWKDGKPIGKTVTDENGAYRFDGLWPGQYEMQAEKPSGMIFVRPGDPNYQDGASAILTSEGDAGSSGSFTLEMAKHQLEKNILYIKPAKVGDLAWLDENGNGLLDGEEKRLPGVTIALVQNGQTMYETTTDAYGYYLLDNVYPGEYVLQAKADPALTPTTPVPQLRIISSCLTGGDGSLAESDAFQVVSGSNNRDFDVGYVLKEGMTLPESMMQEAPGRDWTLTNQKE